MALFLGCPFNASMETITSRLVETDGLFRTNCLCQDNMGHLQRKSKSLTSTTSEVLSL